MQVAHHPGTILTALRASSADFLAWRESQNAAAATAAREGAKLGAEGQNAPHKICVASKWVRSHVQRGLTGGSPQMVQ